MTHYAISQIGTTVAEVTVKDGVVTPVRTIMGFDLDLLDVSRLFGSVEAAARAALRLLDQIHRRQVNELQKALTVVQESTTGKIRHNENA